VPQSLQVSRTPTRTATDPGGVYTTHLGSREDERTPRHSLDALAVDAIAMAGQGAYRFTTAQGLLLGPFTLAEAVHAISTGRIAKFDRVAMGAAEPRSVGEVPELARHLPSSTATSISVYPEAEGAAWSGETYRLTETGGLVAAFASAQVDRTTGLLLCELGGVRKEVYLKDGSPAFVTSNLAGELLGEYLVARQVISRGELDMALAVMPRFEGRLGDTLSALGLVEPVVLFRHIGDQVRDKLLELFAWTHGTCTIYRGVAPPPSGFPLNIDGWDVLDEGLRRRVEAGLETERLALLRQFRLLPASGPRLSSMRHALPQRLKQLLSDLDAPRNLDELSAFRAARELPEQTLRDLLLLHYLGAVRSAEA
jgi:hypothetical protein